MIVRVQAFGVAKTYCGRMAELTTESDGITVGVLKSLLEAQFAQLKDLNTYFIAVNHVYAPDDLLIQERDEVALIPPVSGG